MICFIGYLVAPKLPIAAKTATAPRTNIPIAISPSATQVYPWVLAHVVLASEDQVLSGLTDAMKFTVIMIPTKRAIMVDTTAKTAPLIYSFTPIQSIWSSMDKAQSIYKVDSYISIHANCFNLVK